MRDKETWAHLKIDRNSGNINDWKVSKENRYKKINSSQFWWIKGGRCFLLANHISCPRLPKPFCLIRWFFSNFQQKSHQPHLPCRALRKGRVAQKSVERKRFQFRLVSFNPSTIAQDFFNSLMRNDAKNGLMQEFKSRNTTYDFFKAKNQFAASSFRN